MKHLLLPLSIALLIASCSSKSEKKDNNPNASDEVIDEQIDEVIEEPAIDSLWNYYAGSVGTYDSPIVMELSFNGSDVTGNYWYAKHKKRIHLKGEYDSTAQEVQLNETVKGKITGHFTFKVEDDQIQGSWFSPSATASSEKQSFYCETMYTAAKKHMKPTFDEYEFNHEIDVFDPEIDNFKTEVVTDYCSITNIGNDRFIILYDAIGHNYHTGSISGTGKYLTPKLGQFKGEEGCELSIKFFENEIIIEEEQACDYYKGHRAYFGGTLSKIMN
ncbi:MAG: hypothetical protein ACJASQ_000137 [Crocinitomicaceae bacterium]|jgi:hypothetical protein